MYHKIMMMRRLVPVMKNVRMLSTVNRITQEPVTNKQGKVTSMKNTTGTYQSEIYLSKENDIKRFYELTNK